MLPYIEYKSLMDVWKYGMWYSQYSTQGIIGKFHLKISSSVLKYPVAQRHKSQTKSLN